MTDEIEWVQRVDRATSETLYERIQDLARLAGGIKEDQAEIRTRQPEIREVQAGVEQAQAEIKQAQGRLEMLLTELAELVAESQRGITAAVDSLRSEFGEALRQQAVALWEVSERVVSLELETAGSAVTSRGPAGAAPNGKRRPGTGQALVS